MLEDVRLNLAGLAAGRYRVEWWDTYAGQQTTHAIQATQDGRLTLRVPGGAPDVACKVRRIGD